MLFNSLQYALFLPAAFLAFRLAPPRWRLDVLLLASYLFYAFWSIPYAALMFVLAVANYLFGLAISRARERRRVVLAACITFDLAALGLFKYWSFLFDTSAFALRFVLGADWEAPALGLLLPLGISFFTFEFVHYLVDVYRGCLPVHSFSKFHVFVAFFSTQIAGPIKRFQQFVPALDRLNRFNRPLARDGLRLIALGLGKKIMLADKLAPIADVGFQSAASGDLGTWQAWIVVLAFSLQIYFDFSGYTDIARGSAQLFGFHIPANFNAPCLASNVSDFWRRWHISLSTWLRDYVFIPLGGSRQGLLRTVRNLLITMALGGLWHGAAWHFVVWGLYWGGALAAYRLARAWLPVPGGLAAALAGWLITQVIVLIGWVLFRSKTLTEAGSILTTMFSITPASEEITVGQAIVVLAVTALALLVPLIRTNGWRPACPPLLRPVLIGAALALVVAYAVVAEPPTAQRFVYFQF
jgi:alginate O-acetyltransferase complex protein AlgI